MKDPSVSDSYCTHRILDSLLPPASEMTKHLGPHAKPSAYLELLDSAYGTVEDGDELYARFRNTLQNDGEKPSAFLQRLHVALGTTMRRGGVSSHDFDQQLLKQFCRGCWENSLIVDLQLEQRKRNPSSFAELLLLLRTEEDKQAAKVSHMKQHLGSTKPVYSASKQRVMSHLQTAYAATDSDYCTEVEMLRKEISDISAQLNSMTVESKKQKLPKQKAKSLASSAKAEAHLMKKKGTTQQSPAIKMSSKPRPWYCFQCGEDGHIVSACDNEPNPSLIAAKKKQLRERQAAWESSNPLGNQAHLN
ncbi:zinc finger CCHC domain-containing protein 18-like [Neoarius graeffei]|uniref:zinc finger CCHC domain-containing protein 18-like n=1 Tax=Neoarius graeffei TaxID=443677 RepID=UPI00298D07FC|nr:zinc finger CCHC domain-containing protein 18-like [Neoarius graeffei]